MNYVNEWWNSTDGTNYCAEADEINVIAGQDEPDIDFSLAEGATISGAIYDSEGTPITDQSIHVGARLGDPCGDNEQISGTNPASGSYTIKGVPLGDVYLVTHHDQYLNEWWTGNSPDPSSYDCENAQPINITGTDPVFDKDFQLELGGSISGTVYESDGSTEITGDQIEVRAIEGDPCGNHQHVGWATSDSSNGIYTLMGLPAGNYYLQTNNMNQSNYVNEWWASGGSSLDCNAAEPVTVSVGGSVSGIAFQLDAGGSISGTVYESDGIALITGLWMHVFSEACGGRWLGGAYTDESGVYSILGLPAGSVYVQSCAGCDGHNYMDEWWRDGDGTSDCNKAGEVPVTAEGTTQNIDFQLDTDSDGDGMGDDWEDTYFGDLSHDGSADSDFDGLTDYQEYQENTYPNDFDSDNDGVSDGDEVANGTDPNDPLSFTPAGTGVISGRRPD
jgi:hypothetical protein